MVVDLQNGEVGLASNAGVQFTENNASENFTEIRHKIPGTKAPGYYNGLDYTQLTLTADTTDSSLSSDSSSSSNSSENKKTGKNVENHWNSKKQSRYRARKETTKNGNSRGESKKQSGYIRFHHS
ncbi:unnamed protein product [Ambrosiozyma monospora]|uniref:Unnamed protein product n=1 Tax=Ambrosiozyma monospora TaxID=43982 RepID=A0ACB5T9X4_AMBMO|nr:unnamed protein product [Ambrosiozyma monospora]